MRLTVRESLLAFKRAPLLSALSILTIAFSLFAFALFALVALNVGKALREVEERVEIRAFVTDGTTRETIETASADIAAFPEVQNAVTVTPEEALAKARKELGEFQDVFDAAVLPASLEIHLKPGFRDPETVKNVAARIQTYPFVEEVRYGEEWVAKLNTIRNIATAAGIALGIAFAAVAVIIIGATIRMAVLARAREISIMKMVGATDGFIRRPFLLDGLAKGLIGGALALLLTWFAASLISTYMLRTTFFTWQLALLGACCGGLIGLFGSALSVGRHLRKI
ncbi:MAG: ABC transporter permease [Gemmatimonadota bacterium]|nr:ABC transporter permease [Gemmatimonadota bacterium]